MIFNDDNYPTFPLFHNNVPESAIMYSNPKGEKRRNPTSNGLVSANTIVKISAGAFNEVLVLSFFILFTAWSLSPLTKI